MVDGSKKRPDEAFHYDLNQAAKFQLEAFLKAEASPQDVGFWIDLILLLRAGFGMPPVGSTAEILDAAQAFDAAATAPADGDVLIVAGPNDRGSYALHGAIVLPVDQRVPDSVTHVGFTVEARFIRRCPQWSRTTPGS